jgi:NADH dehydrogenase
MPRGFIVPGLAPAAKQQGQYVARNISTRLRKTSAPPFVYRSFGKLATIGRKVALAEFGHLRFTGLFAWLLWSVAHIFLLIGFRNRITVAIDWFWAYLTFERGARLISSVAPTPTEKLPIAVPRLMAVAGTTPMVRSER